MRLASEILFHALMALAAVAITWRMRRRGRFDPVAAAAFVAACAVLAYLLGEGVFHRARLLAYALFAYGVVTALACAVVLGRRSRRGAVVAALIAVVVAAVGVDAFVVEPRWLEITRVRMQSSKLEGSLRIAIVADLQFDELGDHERATLAAALAERPDVVLFAGDYAQAPEPQRSVARRALAEHLRAIAFDAPLGVYVVRGNVDAPGWTAAFEGTPFVLFETTRTVARDRFAVTGLSVEDSFTRSGRVAPSERFHIALGHSPDFALGDIQADLLVAGHTHGGQVRLPFIGPLLTFSGVPRDWAAGVTQLEGGRTLIVSRGTGMERGRAPRLRFNCRPELVIVDVVGR